MKSEIPEYLSDELGRFIATHTGLHFPPKKRRTMLKGVSAAAEAMGAGNMTDFIVNLLNAPPSREALDTLVKYLTIGETFFLRDKPLFQILRDDIFRGILQNPRHTEKKIRIWSAGCSTGEEPYSVAILIDQMENQFRGWEITILGTDLNPHSLEKARAGQFTRWSFRDTPDDILTRYFTPADAATFEIVPVIRNRVRFTQLNFAADDYGRLLSGAGPMDIILCRNVLMYFDAPVRDAVISRLNRMLIDNGWLIVGPAESGFVNEPGLTPVRFPNAVLHRKGPPRQEEREGSSDFWRVPEKISRDHSRPSRRKSDTVYKKPPETDHFQEALSAFNNGNYRRTIRILEALIESSSANAERFLLIAGSQVLTARAYANLGELREAEHWCRAAINHEKLNPAHYYLLATIYQEDGRQPEAIKAVKQALYLDPEFVMGHFTLGVLMQQAGRMADARKHLHNAVALLQTMGDDDAVPHSDGITAGRLRQTAQQMTDRKSTHAG